MARARSPNRDKAFEIYKKHKGSIQLREIAKILDTPEKTISGWKVKDKWDDNLNGVLQSKIRSTPNKKKNTKKKDKEPIAEEVKEVLANTELTDKQRLFCIYYIKSFNQTMAAIKAGYSPERAHVTGSELVRNSKIKVYIRKLKGKMTEEIFIDAMDVLNKYINIAFADVTDYLTFGQKEAPVIGPFGPIKDEEGKELTKTVNYVDFKESNMIDGTIVSEVKQGKDGVSVKFEDRMKALDKLSQYFDLFPDKFKRQIEQQKLEIAKIKAGDIEPDEFEDDGFVEALKGEVEEVWSDEDTE